MWCSPLSTPSFDAPSVRISVIAVMSAGSFGPITRSVSSKRTRPQVPGGFRGQPGTVCFWPESAMEQNQVPCFGRNRNSRMSCFSPLEAVHRSGGASIRVSTMTL